MSRLPGAPAASPPAALKGAVLVQLDPGAEVPTLPVQHVLQPSRVRPRRPLQVEVPRPERHQPETDEPAIRSRGVRQVYEREVAAEPLVARYALVIGQDVTAPVVDPNEATGT